MVKLSLVYAGQETIYREAVYILSAFGTCTWDNFYRRLKQVLNLQWIYKATKKYYGTKGQKSIDPVVFFKLMLIGYLENLGSDRRIVSAVSMRLDMLYFLGYDILW